MGRTGKIEKKYNNKNENVREEETHRGRQRIIICVRLIKNPRSQLKC